MSYFSGQGKVYGAPIDNGVVGAYRWWGNVTDFKPTFDTSKLEHKESYTGQRLTDKVITTENKAQISANLEDWSRENLALATRGSVNSVPSGTVKDEVSPAGLVEGSIWALAHQKVSSVVIKDSAATPVIVDPKDYSLVTGFGSVTLGNISKYVLPLTASYSYAGTDSVAFFTSGIQEVALRFEGLNTAEKNKNVLVEIYRVALDPTKELGLISNDWGVLTLTGNALIDETKPDNDTVFGKFGRIVYL